MRSALVTGAAGFIGSFLCERLVADGWRVTGVDNLFRGCEANLRSLDNEPRFRLVKLDLSCSSTVEQIRSLLRADEIRTIFNFAAINGTQYFYDAPRFVLEQNVRIVSNMAAALSDTPVERVIYASSSEVYGDPDIVPTPEGHPIKLNAAAVRDSYALSKAMGEFSTRLVAEELGLSFANLRLFNTYGERMVNTRYGQVIPEFIQRCLQEETFTMLGDGRHTRSFCYVQDTIDQIVKLSVLEESLTCNVGNDEEISIEELARVIHDLVQREYEPVRLNAREHDHLRRCPDLSLVRMLVQPSHPTPLGEGLRKTIAYYRGIGSGTAAS